MFYRVNKMTSQVFAVPFDECDLELEVGNIRDLVYSGDATLLCDDLEAAAEIFNVAVEEIVIVDSV